jgi:UDP-N-acetylmuramoyl-L-alanyl-D-glutamate--2,6-diaminopimelate ligase
LTVGLKEILAVLENPMLDGDSSVEISGASHDSRKIRPGWLFVAMAGENSDGHDFIAQAIHAGASAVIAEKPSRKTEPVPWIQCRIQDLLWGRCGTAERPAHDKMVLVGITGPTARLPLLSHGSDGEGRWR